MFIIKTLFTVVISCFISYSQVTFDLDVSGCHSAQAALSNTTDGSDHIAIFEVIEATGNTNSYDLHIHEPCQSDLSRISFNFTILVEQLSNKLYFNWYSAASAGGSSYSYETCCWSVSSVKIHDSMLITSSDDSSWNITICTAHLSSYQYNDKIWVCPYHGGTLLNNNHEQVLLFTSNDISLIQPTDRTKSKSISDSSSGSKGKRYVKSRRTRSGKTRSNNREFMPENECVNGVDPSNIVWQPNVNCTNQSHCESNFISSIVRVSEIHKEVWF